MKNKPYLFWFFLILGCIFLFSLVLVMLGVDGSDKKLNFSSLDSGGNIGVVEVKGIIIDSKETVEQLHEFRDNDNIKGIILRVDSPGGMVGPSQEIFEEIKKIKKVKKVVASFASTAASGGYYVACGADKIVSNPGTLTGSIGVIMEFMNMEDLYGWAKVKPRVIKSGKFKDIGSTSREMTDSEKEILNDLVKNVHSQFNKAIQESRKLKPEIFEKISDGRILTGEQAKSLGLVDELGNMEDAIDLIAKLVNLKDKPKTVYPKKDEPSLINILMNSSLSHFAQKIFNLSENRHELINSSPRLLLLSL